MFSTLRKVTAVLLIAGACAGTVARDATAQALLLRFSDAVAAYSTQQWTQFVRAGSHRLEVRGDGDTDLDCFVTDRYGNVLGSDTDATDFCVVTWFQSSDRRIDVRIDNLGHVYNRYELRLR